MLHKLANLHAMILLHLQIIIVCHPVTQSLHTIARTVTILLILHVIANMGGHRLLPIESI